MNKQIITIDVGNIPPKEVDEYMKNVIRKLKGLGPVVKEEKTEWQKFKSWLYNMMDRSEGFKINNEDDKVFEDADKSSKWYYERFEKVKNNMIQDLKALGKTDEEILKEFVTDAYWYGYVNAKRHPGQNFGGFK